MCIVFQDAGREVIERKVFNNQGLLGVKKVGFMRGMVGSEYSEFKIESRWLAVRRGTLRSSTAL